MRQEWSLRNRREPDASLYWQTGTMPRHLKANRKSRPKSASNAHVSAFVLSRVAWKFEHRGLVGVIDAYLRVAFRWRKQMPEVEAEHPLDADARRTALEVIAILVNVKRVAADHLLRPAGVPQPLIKRFVSGRDATTNEPLTKRQGGVLILDERARDGKDGIFVRKLLDIAANWDAFHLAADEFKAS